MIIILYVDDEVINLELFELTFQNEFNIFRSLSPKEALLILDKEPIDVVVSDLRMPEMDGIEFIRAIKRKYPAKNCILLTAYHEPQIKNDPQVKSILYKYMLKPFNKNELKSTIIQASK